MEILKTIEKERKLQGVSWDKLAQNLPISGNALRIAFTRTSVDEVYIEEIKKVLDIDQTDQSEQKIQDNKRKVFISFGEIDLDLDEIAIGFANNESKILQHKYFSNLIDLKVNKKLNLLLRNPEKLNEFLES